MSEHKVEVVPFKLKPCPNSDRLSIAHIKGWQCVVRTEDFKNESLGIYIPIDSVVPDTEEFSFLDMPSKNVSIEEYKQKLVCEGAKFVRLKNRRVHTIKLRGNISQGILLPASAYNVSVGQDVTSMLNITKYKPQETKSTSKFFGSGQSGFLRDNDPVFSKYTDMEDIKNYPDVFEDGEQVTITEKIHGTNFRVGRISDKIYVGSHNKIHVESIPVYNVKTCFKFIQKIFRLKTEHFPNFMLSKIIKTNPFVYHKIVKEFKLIDKLHELFAILGRDKEVIQIILYGEIYGKGVQDLTYGCEKQELVIFDIMVDGVYLPWQEVISCCGIMGLKTVPVLYTGKFSMDKVKECTEGMSTIAPNQMKEGSVIKPIEERFAYNLGRVILKSRSEAYLEKTNRTDFH